jgi:hypothetical protein
MKNDVTALTFLDTSKYLRMKRENTCLIHVHTI